MTSSFITIAMPKVVRVDDYHDLDTISYNINLVADTPCSVAEIGWDDETGKYAGVLYLGKKPSDDELRALIAEFDAAK